jgi:hypothetical protein
MIVHLVDGTYELFRHFYGLRRFIKGKDRRTLRCRRRRDADRAPNVLRRMTDSLHSRNSNHDGLRSGRHRSLLAKMPKPNAGKRRVNRVKGSAPRGHARVKGFASRGRAKKWILLLLVVLLLIPAMQVAVVRFINPPWTLPMLIEKVGATFSKAPKAPLVRKWSSLFSDFRLQIANFKLLKPLGVYSSSCLNFEARRLLLQSARPGTRRLFAEVISRMDEPRKAFAHVARDRAAEPVSLDPIRAGR